MKNMKRRSFWLKNTNGKPDAMLTMAMMAFVTVLLRLMFSNVTLEILDKTVTVGSIESSAIAAVLTPTLGAYIARRYTDKKYPEEPASKDE